MACRCGWGCNCISLFGIRRQRELEVKEVEEAKEKSGMAEAAQSAERMTDLRKAVVLLSGGMDSCVSAAMARERHGASNIALLHASYGQRTEQRERRAFDEIADFYGVGDRLVAHLEHFRAIGGSALTDKSISVP